MVGWRGVSHCNQVRYAGAATTVIDCMVAIQPFLLLRSSMTRNG